MAPAPRHWPFAPQRLALSGRLCGRRSRRNENVLPRYRAGIPRAAKFYDPLASAARLGIAVSNVPVRLFFTGRKRAPSSAPPPGILRSAVVRSDVRARSGSCRACPRYGNAPRLDGFASLQHTACTIPPGGCRDRAGWPVSRDLLHPSTYRGAGASSPLGACASPSAGVLPSLPLAIGRFTPVHRITGYCLPLLLRPLLVNEALHTVHTSEMDLRRQEQEHGCRKHALRHRIASVLVFTYWLPDCCLPGLLFSSNDRFSSFSQ
jgi:hypothetical protein